VTPDEPMIVVFGTIGGGTSAVASVLHHLGVFMGTEFGASYRELQQNWEEAGIGQLCRRAVMRAADSSRWNLMCSKRSSESGLKVIAALPAPLGAAQASSIPYCAPRSICSMMRGARSCRWWWIGLSPKCWRL